MTLVLELTEEEEARLQALAKQEGIDAAQLARRLLSLQLASSPPAPLSDEEWDALEEELSEGIDPTIPPLSDEAVSRASFYADPVTL